MIDCTFFGLAAFRRHGTAWTPSPTSCADLFGGTPHADLYRMMGLAPDYRQSLLVRRTYIQIFRTKESAAFESQGGKDGANRKPFPFWDKACRKTCGQPQMSTYFPVNVQVPFHPWGVLTDASHSRRVCATTSACGYH